MAFNPFRTFQRNQKGCMAGVTLLAIISFLFLGVIIQLLGGRGGSGPQIETFAESRRFGKITSYDLHRLQENQETLRRFLFVLFQKLADPTDEEKMRALSPLQMFINQTANSQSPEQLINAWLLTQYAQEEGISPDWNDISNLLKELTGGYLSDTVYDDTLSAVGIPHQTVEYLLARHIRQEQVLRRFHGAISAISPLTRWDWYQRLYRQITIEAAAVPVEPFISQVNDPGVGQLNAFFEQHKTIKYNPMLPESGFIMPTELAFQYVVAEPSQQLLDSITEEEMQTFYEENKESLFRKPVKPITDFPQLPGMMPGGAMPFPSPGRGVIPSIPLPTTETPEPDEPALPEPTPETPSESEESMQESTPESSAVPRVLTRFVSYQMDKSEAVETEAVETEQPTTIESTESEAVDLSILYRPFDEVKNQIRETIAYEKAVAGLSVIQEKMREYAVIYNEHFEQGKSIPPMPDLTDFAAEQGLVLKTVPMGDVYAAMRTELARGLQERRYLVRMFAHIPLLFENETFSGSNGQVLLWVTDMKPEKRPENIGEVREIVLKRWKEVEARTLALKKAEELANEATTSGKPLAEVFAGRSDVPVTETEPFTWKTYGGLHPLTAVMQRQPPVLSEVREREVAVGNADIDNQIIIAPGSDFMETVFALQVGETGVVFNQPKTMAYIVRITSSSPSVDVLWERFQRAHIMEYVYAGQQEMVSSAFDAWLDEIRQKTGFRWVNKPESRVSGQYDE